MSKSPESVEVGDNVRIGKNGDFGVVTRIMTFIIKPDIVVDANSTTSNQELDETKSPTEQVYHFVGVSLKHDFTLFMKYRGTDLLGTKDATGLTIDDAPEGDPFPVNVFTNVQGIIFKAQNDQAFSQTVTPILQGRIIQYEILRTAPDNFTILPVDQGGG